MKYLFCLSCLFIFFINPTLAESNLELTNKIISIKKIEDFNLQSFTTVNNNLFIVLIGHNDTESLIKVYNLDDLKEIKSYRFHSLGHANGTTYDSKENKIYVLNSNGSTIIHIFNGSTFEYLDSFNIDLPARSIAYNEDNNTFLIRTFINGYQLTNDLKLTNKTPFITGLNANSYIAHQDWTYYQDYLYYCNWSWPSHGGDGTNYISVYNLQGQLIANLTLSANLGEIESVAFYNNQMISGFNAPNNYINFYLQDIPQLSNTYSNKQDTPLKQSPKVTKFTNPLIYLLPLIFILIFIKLIFIKKKTVK